MPLVYAYSLMNDKDQNGNLIGALVAQTKNAREEKWGELFQTLGMVIHHIQDMAQPQHVRDDQHCNGDIEDVDCYGFHNPSWYEEYTNDNMDIALEHVDCSSYQTLDLKRFSKARDFWITAEGAGIGIAEFTNRNFVSAGTNFRRRLWNGRVVADADYPNPTPLYSGDVPDYNDVDIRVLLENPAFELPGVVRFLKTQVTDSYLDGFTDTNKRASSYSLWNDKLDRYNANNFTQDPERLFNLNQFNFKAAYPFLIPRAISYSAGLINYFFRGRVEVKGVQYLAGDKIILTVKNITSEKNPGNAPFSFIDGDFTLYYDDAEGNRYPLPPHDVDTEFKDESEISLQFKLPANIDAIDTSRPFTLVFDGRIGAPDLDQNEWERGIAAKVFHPYPLIAFNVEGYAGGAPVPNIINTYRSFDLGMNWEKAEAFSVTVDDDTTDDPENKVKIQNAIFSGEDGGVLVYASYTDYDPLFEVRRVNYSAQSYDVGQTWQGISTDFNYLTIGTENFSDGSSVLASVAYTGDLTELSALRVQHPPAGDPPPASRTFQLAKSSDWGSPGSWALSGGFIPGGLPELDYLGEDSYAFAAYVEQAESSDPETLQFDSALRRTDDGGSSYYDLTRFAQECTQEDEFCVQHLVYLGKDDAGNERLLGWAERNVDSYDSPIPSNQVPLYTSENGGLSWNLLKYAPLNDECNAVGKRHLTVDNILYTGSHKENGQDLYALFLETSCYEIFEHQDGGYDHHSLSGKSYFTTLNSGGHWTEVSAPPGPESLIIYAGDNGAIPGLYD